MFASIISSLENVCPQNSCKFIYEAAGNKIGAPKYWLIKQTANNTTLKNHIIDCTTH